MSDQKKPQKATPEPDAKANEKESETVHLTAQELRNISGGLSHPMPQPPKTGQ